MRVKLSSKDIYPLTVAIAFIVIIIMSYWPPLGVNRLPYYQSPYLVVLAAGLLPFAFAFPIAFFIGEYKFRFEFAYYLFPGLVIFMLILLIYMLYSEIGIALASHGVPPKWQDEHNLIADSLRSIFINGYFTGYFSGILYKRLFQAHRVAR